MHLIFLKSGTRGFYKMEYCLRHKNKKVYFKTNRFKDIKSFSLFAFDLNCTAIAKVWDMNQKASGSVNNLFQNFNTDLNKEIVETAAKESEDRVSISQKNIDALWQYAPGIKCK